MAEGIIGSRSQSGYHRVLWSVTGEDGHALEVQAYVADGAEDHMPDRRYVARVLDWARFWNLPDEHLEVLKRHLARSRDW